MDNELDGLGAVPHPRLPAFGAGHRCLLSPVRYPRLRRSTVEAMALGMPVLPRDTVIPAPTGLPMQEAARP